MSSYKSYSEYAADLNDANVRAALDAIAYAEGTLRAANPYGVGYGYTTITSFDDHPRSATTARGYTSSAAGKYQALTRSWDEVAKAVGLKDFSPKSQDIFAIARMDMRGILDDVKAGKVKEALSTKAAGLEWASLPASPYGQPTKSKSALNKAIDGFVQAHTPGPAQPIDMAQPAQLGYGIPTSAIAGIPTPEPNPASMTPRGILSAVMSSDDLTVTPQDIDYGINLANTFGVDHQVMNPYGVAEATKNFETLSPEARTQIGKGIAQSVTEANQAGIKGGVGKTGYQTQESLANPQHAFDRPNLAAIDSIGNVKGTVGPNGPNGLLSVDMAVEEDKAYAAMTPAARNSMANGIPSASPQQAAPNGILGVDLSKAQTPNDVQQAPAGYDYGGLFGSTTPSNAQSVTAPAAQDYSAAVGTRSTPTAPSVPTGPSGMPSLDALAGTQMDAIDMPGSAKSTGILGQPAPSANVATVAPPAATSQQSKLDKAIEKAASPTLSKQEKALSAQQKGSTIGGMSKDTVKGAIAGGLIGGLPGAVLGGLLGNTVGSGNLNGISNAVGGILGSFGGILGGRGPSEGFANAGQPGASYGGYGDGGGFDAQSYGYGGASQGMGGYEQFGGGFVGPGSGGLMDAGQGFGQGSAADFGT